jgi:hypothetical protein
MHGRRRRTLLLLALVEPLALWLRGYAPFGGRVVVRCRQGHVYTTLWIPGVSVKSVRLLWWRVQRCPVGRHWSVVTPVRPSELSARERWLAGRRRDLPLP